VTNAIGGLFNFSDNMQMTSLDMRLKRKEVISSNIANAETPGFRAFGYSFEEQLRAVAEIDNNLSMNVSHPKHLRNSFVTADGKIKPDIYIRPTETVAHDGNTVDIDEEMARMAQNEILYRSAVELINRKVGVLRYAINGGR
jgi:flagellar basal-body rod protein FlgB